MLKTRDGVEIKEGITIWWSDTIEKGYKVASQDTTVPEGSSYANLLQGAYADRNKAKLKAINDLIDEIKEKYEEVNELNERLMNLYRSE